MQQKLSIFNFTVRNLLSKDTDLINLGDMTSYDATSTTIPEILVFNMTLENNVMVQTKRTIRVSPVIFVQQTKSFDFTFVNCSWKGNYLHTYTSDVVALYASSSALIFDSQVSTFRFINSSMYNNSAFVNKNGLFVQAQSALISNSTFSHSNKYKFNADASAQSMMNDGGSAFLQANQIDIQSCAFSHSYANRGGALFLVASGTNSAIFLS